LLFFKKTASAPICVSKFSNFRVISGHRKVAVAGWGNTYMKVALTMAILAASLVGASPVMAERYVVTAFNLDEGHMSAIDLDTLKKVGSNWRAWTVSVFASDKQPSFFAQSLTEFDCSTDRRRSLSVKAFDPSGEFTGNLNPEDWDFPAPNSAAYAAMEYACGTKRAEPKEIVSVTTVKLFEAFRDTMRESKSK
jgi:hypothetical protein